MIFYRYDDELQKFNVQSPEAIHDEEPGLKITMYSCCPQQASYDVESCFDQEDYATFIAGFKQQDVAKLILMCAVGHIQLPTNTRGNTREVSSDFKAVCTEFPLSLTEIPNSKHCSKLAFEQFSLAAKRYGIFSTQRASIGQRVPIQVNHAYLSTAKLDLQDDSIRVALSY